METWQFYVAGAAAMFAIGTWFYRAMGAKAPTSSVEAIERKVDALDEKTGELAVCLGRHDERLIGIEKSLMGAHGKLDKILINGNGHRNGKLKTRKSDKP